MGLDYEVLTIQWAKEFFQLPFVALHASCTGSDDRDVVLRVCVMSSVGEVLLSSLIQPPKTKPIKAEWVDGLYCTKDELKSAPEYQSVRKQLKELCKGKNVIVVSRWIMRIFEQTADRTGGNKLNVIMHDIQNIEYNLVQRVSDYDGRRQMIPLPESEALTVCEDIVERMKKVADVVSTF